MINFLAFLILALKVIGIVAVGAITLIAIVLLIGFTSAFIQGAADAARKMLNKDGDSDDKNEG